MEIKSQEAVDKVKEYLLVNGFMPGERSPIKSELSAALGISARPLRDAINVLVNQGLLIPRGRAGTYMSNPERESVVEPIRWFYEIKQTPSYDLIQARIILERAIIAEACVTRTTKDLLMLQQIVDAQGQAGLSADAELKLDKEFHLQLVSCVHNKALDVVGNIILLQLDLVHERGLYPEDDHIRSSDHQKIIDLLFSRDVEKATEFITTHIERCCVIANEASDNPLE